MENLRYALSDTDITFYVQVFRDYRDAYLCLKKLRLHYKSSRVIMISDGDNDPRYERLSKRFNTDFISGERLYPVENGGKMLQRMLDAFLEQPSSYLIKLDTDTRIHRRFRFMPAGTVVFGTLEWETSQGKSRLDFPNVQGGCLGFTLESARMIADSGLLLSERLADYRGTYADNQDIIIRAEKMGLISADFIIRYACRQLDIPVVQFDEVYAIYRGTIPPGGGGFAVTHPHKSPINHFKNGRFGILLTRLLGKFKA
jgi:hypothetical protein